MVFCRFVVLLLLLALSAAASGVRQRTFSLLWFSDVQLDNFYNTPDAAGGDEDCKQAAHKPYGTPGCYTPVALAAYAAGKEAGRSLYRHDAILVSGSFSPPDLAAPEFILEAINTTMTTIQKIWDPIYFPYIVNIGPQDVFPNYFYNTSAPTLKLATNNFLENVSEVFAEKGVFGPPSADTFVNPQQEHFAEGGYYRKDMLMDPVTILSLNTGLFSRKLKPNPPTEKSDDDNDNDDDDSNKPFVRPGNLTDPAGQLQWLHEQLEDMRHTNRWVIIMGSIPPGIDFAVEKYAPDDLATADYKTFFADFQLDEYAEIVANYSGIITAQLFSHNSGHAHFRLIQGMVVYNAPSLSPRSYADPTYTTFDIDVFAGTVKNWKLHSISLKNGTLSEVNTTNDILQANHATYSTIALFYKWLPRMTDRFDDFLSKMWNSNGEYARFNGQSRPLFSEGFMSTLEQRNAMACAYTNMKTDSSSFKQCMGTCAPLFYVQQDNSHWSPIAFVESRPFWQLTRILQLPFLIGVIAMIIVGKRRKQERLIKEARLHAQREASKHHRATSSNSNSKKMQRHPPSPVMTATSSVANEEEVLTRQTSSGISMQEDFYLPQANDSMLLYEDSEVEEAEHDVDETAEAAGNLQQQQQFGSGLEKRDSYGGTSSTTLAPSNASSGDFSPTTIGDDVKIGNRQLSRKQTKEINDAVHEEKIQRLDALKGGAHMIVLLTTGALGLWIAKKTLAFQLLDMKDTLTCYYKAIAFFCSFCRPVLLAIMLMQVLGVALQPEYHFRGRSRQQQKQAMQNVAATFGAAGVGAAAASLPSNNKKKKFICCGCIPCPAWLTSDAIATKLVDTFGRFPAYSRIWLVATVVWGIWDTLDSVTTTDIYSATWLMKVDIVIIAFSLMLLYFVGSYHAASHYATKEAVVKMKEFSLKVHALQQAIQGLLLLATSATSADGSSGSVGAARALQLVQQFYPASVIKRSTASSKPQASDQQQSSSSFVQQQPQLTPDQRRQLEESLEAYLFAAEPLVRELVAIQVDLCRGSRLAWTMAREALPALHGTSKALRQLHRLLKGAHQELQFLDGAEAANNSQQQQNGNNSIGGSGVGPTSLSPSSAAGPPLPAHDGATHIDEIKVESLPSSPAPVVATTGTPAASKKNVSFTGATTTVDESVADKSNAQAQKLLVGALQLSQRVLPKLQKKADLEIEESALVNWSETLKHLASVLISTALAGASSALSVYSTALMATIITAVTNSGFDAIDELSILILKYDLVKALILVVAGEVLMTIAETQLKMYCLAIIPTASQLTTVFIYLYLQRDGRSLGALLGLGVSCITVFTMLGSVQYFFVRNPEAEKVSLDEAAAGLTQEQQQQQQQAGGVQYKRFSPTSAASSSVSNDNAALLSTPEYTRRLLWKNSPRNAQAMTSGQGQSSSTNTAPLSSPTFTHTTLNIVVKVLLVLTSLLLVIAAAIVVLENPQFLKSPNVICYTAVGLQVILFVFLFAPVWLRRITGRKFSNVVVGTLSKRTLVILPDNADLICRLVAILMWFVMIRYWLTSNGSQNGADLTAMTAIALAQRRVDPLPIYLRELFTEATESLDLVIEASQGVGSSPQDLLRGVDSGSFGPNANIVESSSSSSSGLIAGSAAGREANGTVREAEDA